MSGGSQNTVSQQTVPSWLQPYLTSALSQGQTLQQTGGPAYYPGQQVAPLNPVQEQGINSIVDTANQPNATTGAEGANQFETSGALLNPSSNPYLQGTFTQAANAVQNQLSSEFAGSGRNITGSLPIQSDEMNNLATQLYGGQYDTGLNAMTQASALAPSLDASTYLPGQQLLSTGAGLQNQTQNLINSDMNAYNYTAQLPYNTLSWYSGLVGQNATPFSSSSSQSTATNSPWSTAAGAGLTAAALYPAASGLLGGIGTALAADAIPIGTMGLSDRRLKRDVEHIGSTGAGIPIYNFRYLWDLPDHPARTGVMADEVSRIIPDAVQQHSSGFLMVDYGKVK